MHEVQLRVLCSSALRIVDPFHVRTAHHVFAARGNTTAAGTITPAAAAAAAAVQTPGRAEVKRSRVTADPVCCNTNAQIHIHVHLDWFSTPSLSWLWRQEREL